MKCKIIVFLVLMINSINVLFSQTKAVEIVIPLNDSVYVWKGNGADELWYNFYTSDSAIVIDFNDSVRTISRIHSMCGRGFCPGGVDIDFYNNGLVKSKGSYGFTTNIDSLKYVGGDGFLDYVDKVGYWYYWNEKGFLIRRENWKMGKLVEVINYKTVVLSARPKKAKI